MKRSMTCISYAIGEETNSWTKVGESEQSTRRGGDSMLLWYFSLPIILFLFLHWDIYICCSYSTFVEKFVFILLVICLIQQLDLYTNATRMLLLYENSSPYILLHLIDELHYCCRWVTSMNHKLFVETLMYMQWL